MGSGSIYLPVDCFYVCPNRKRLSEAHYRQTATDGRTLPEMRIADHQKIVGEAMETCLERRQLGEVRTNKTTSKAPLP